MYILGINAYHGDASAAIIKDGKLLFAIEEERLRRVKHWAGFPIMAIKAALYEAGISIQQVNHIAISRNPLANLTAKLRYSLLKIRNFSTILDRLKNQSKIVSIKEQLARGLGINPYEINAKVHHVEHHKAHLASTFFVSPYEEAALLSIDGFGDFASTVIGYGKDDRIEIFDKVLFPHSVGIFYTAFTQWLGFRKYGDEYKVMGLSSYGKPVYLDKMLEIIKPTSDGLFKLNTKYFNHTSEGVTMSWDDGEPYIGPLYSDYLVSEFGPPRQKEQPLNDYHKDIAASVQAATEIVIFHILNHLYDLTNVLHLCIAGGVAQNSVANGKIYLKTPFKHVYIPPAATDAGTAVGAAFWVYISELGNSRNFVMDRANWGNIYSDKEIVDVLNRYGLKFRKLEDEELFDQIVEALIEGKVVGWFYDRSEFGPRALGYRSILADPRNPKMRDILNEKIKRREPFRPFAPSVLSEYVSEYFEINYPVPFMEKVFVIKPEKRKLIPAVTHVDGTGRLQTVYKEINPRYYRLIEKFYERTGIPMLLNTSFNENEPIVNSPQDAVNTFLRTKMDVLVLENFIVKREENEIS